MGRSRNIRRRVRLGLFLAVLLIVGSFLLSQNPEDFAAIRYPVMPKEHWPYVKAAREFCKLPAGSEPIIMAVGSVESGFDPKAQSGAGAVGWMQVLIPTGYGMAVKYGIPKVVGRESYFEADKSIMMGSCYLHYLMDYLTGDGSSNTNWDDPLKRKAVFAAYNGGPNQGKRVLSGVTGGHYSISTYAPKVEARIPVYRLDAQRLEQTVSLSTSELIGLRLRDLVTLLTKTDSPTSTE